MSDSNLSWSVGGQLLTSDPLPLLMGIVNVTPDSFSDGGQFQAVDQAVRHADRLLNDGAGIIDIGGESTRPGAPPVSLKEELQRTIPVIEQLSQTSHVVISIDTTKAEVARQAIQAGASIVNDISGMTFDEHMLSVCADSDVAVCVMHIQGTPQTMQRNPAYHNVVDEVIVFLKTRIDACLNAGIAEERICVDPGIGFGKTAEHNLELMKALPRIRTETGRPVLVGHSRKRFLSKLLGRDVEERLAGTVGVSVALAENQADVLRVHDVGAVRDALVAWQAVSNWRAMSSGGSVPGATGSKHNGDSSRKSGN